MIVEIKLIRDLIILACIPILISCASVSTGTNSTDSTVTIGAAEGNTGVDASSTLERCGQTLGTLAVDDGRTADWYGRFGSATNIATIEPLIRLAVQQSNCFVITSIGNLRADSHLSRVTDLQHDSEEYRAGSEQQRGQRVAADYYIEPQIIIDNASTGQADSAIGGLLSPAISALTGTLDTKASVVTLTLFDVRSATQISASEGNATANNYSAAMGAFGGSAGGDLRGFSRTPTGKATVAAFIDAYNGMVRTLKNYEAQDVEDGLGRSEALKVIK